ncbi:MAG: hypothetical protein GOMPHAMPRED_001000 [Gomphillus americanus]|uniref:Uncharacterized protein n=1 Tax=Gomphillus americanus TaxID=1940652 RepID=A0A8H3IJZ7_9LECA|nr:MAG: hypothetical protein GOMPHAMPRED_001000 [Gomphillus americanus]
MTSTCNATEPRSRLSKPRTRPISVTPSPGESRSDLKNSFLRESSPVIVEFPDTVRPPYNTRQNDRPLCKELDTEEDNDIDIGKSLRKRFSRSHTATSKRSSLRMSLGLSRSLTFNNEEQVYERGSDDNLNNTTMRRAFRDELATLNQSLETMIEDGSVPERVISPIRRRSFFTPGLATRNPADMLAKPPKPAQKQQAELEYYYNPLCSTFSPLERIAALDLAGRPETPTARASTPAELDYGLIGRLRITNGMASPSLSSRSGIRRASTGLCNSVDYSDMPHMSLSEDNIIQSYLQSARQSGHFQHPLKTMSMPQDVESCHDTSVGQPDTSGPTTSRALYQNEREREFNSLRSNQHSALSFRDVTSQIAKDYMFELADNPFDIGPSMHDFQATSKPSEVDADLFDDASLKPRESHETLPKSGFVLPHVVDTEDDFEKRTSKLLTQIGTSSSSLGTNSQTDRASLSNEDSGYSSNSSISSFGKRLQVSAHVAIIDRPRPKKSPSTIQGLQQMTKEKRRPTPVTIQTSTTVQDSLFSKTIQGSTDTLHTAITTVSFSNEIPQLVSPRKLQKPRPRSQPPPTNRVAFQMHLEIDPNVIPRIPNELATRMAARVEEVPPLVHTLPSVDHLRLKKTDFDHPPLSAPIRFPSPQPMDDRLWAQVTKAERVKQKSVRSRRSHADGLLFHGSRKKSLNMTESALDLVSPRFVKRLFSNERFDAINDTASHRVDDLQLQKQPVMARSKSMATGLNEREAALSHVRSMAKSFDTKALPDLTNSIRKSSSVYNDGCSAVASSISANALLDLRQSSSVSTLATQSSSLSRKGRGLGPVPHTSPLPTSSGGRSFITAHQTQKFHHLYESSSGESLNSQHDTKSLPPLPLIPIERHTKTHKDPVKKSRTLEKTLPLLPHQKKPVRDPASRLSSPFDEAKNWFAADQERNQYRPAAGSPSSGSISTVQTLRETANRHTRMQSEPPSLPSGKWQQVQHQSVQLPSTYRRPLLPQLDTTSTSQGQHYQNLANDYKLQSPYHRYLNRARGTRSESPEYAQPTWSPAIPELTPQSESDWEWPLSAPPKANLHDTPKQSPSVPDGLVARMSGRFDGGLHYNYEPGQGIHGSAGTRNMQTGVRKSVETSKGYGLDLTDIPIFVYAQGREKECEQGGQWV